MGLYFGDGEVTKVISKFIKVYMQSFCIICTLEKKENYYEIKTHNLHKNLGQIGSDLV